MDKVLITGASGFIGSHVVSKMLQKGYEVHVTTSRSDYRCAEPAVTVHKTDLLNAQQADELIGGLQPDGLIHIAWDLTGGVFLGSQKNLAWVSASLRLLEGFAKHKGKRFVFAGSSSEYDLRTGVKVEPEASAAAPSLYGRCKCAFSSVAELYSATCGVSFANARLFSVYGPGDIKRTRAIPYAVDGLLRGEPIICESPGSIWDYIYIDDAAEGIVSLYESGLIGAVNIASGEPALMGDVFRTIAQITGREDLLQMKNATQPGRVLLASTALMREKLGFVPQTTLAKGLSQTVDWWRQHML